MGQTSERYRKVADQFSERVRAVPAEAWDNPSPCEGWSARDVVRHLVDSATALLTRAGGEAPGGPSVDSDPAGAWEGARTAIQAALDTPTVAIAEYDGPMGRSTLKQTIAAFGIGDVLIHTWDLSRAVGLDEQLDPDEVRRLLAAMQPNEELLRASGAFGPKVDVPDDADEQTKLLALAGRRP